MNIIRSTLIASAAFAASASIAVSAPVLGLTGDKTLVMFDTDKPAVTKTMDVTGVDKLIGIDFRPGNKTVIGVTPDHRIVSINLETGAATDVAKMDKMLTMTEAPVVVDFNPAADRLRFMTGTTNHRVHPDTGAVTVDGTLALKMAICTREKRQTSLPPPIPTLSASRKRRRCTISTRPSAPRSADEAE